MEEWETGGLGFSDLGFGIVEKKEGEKLGR